jgi:cyanophycinase
MTELTKKETAKAVTEDTKEISKIEPKIKSKKNKTINTKYNSRGYLLIIGGAEDKTGENIVLKHARNMVFHDEILSILTTATQDPEESGKNYENVFSRLGLKQIQIIDISTREQANDKKICDKLKQSKCIFFTGGDQLRITSILGGSLAYKIIQDIYSSGGAIMGTSAGASVMSSTMIVEGKDNQPARKCTTKMAPGLGFLDNVIIDQHFDQRGRFGRLLCSVAENPGSLGIGIDEDTAIKVYPDMTFEVLGNNSVTIIDGKNLKSSNVSELAQEELLAVIGITVHAIPDGYGFDLQSREVKRLKKED